MPIKLFEDGEILDASDVNTYFMDQALVVFEDSDERDAAFGGTVGGVPNEPALAEGRICYLKSDDTLYIYTGAAWTAQLATIETNAVTTAKLDSSTPGSEAVSEAKIRNGAVTVNKIGTGAVTSDKILNETIVNTDISPSAAITHSKLANATAGQVLLGTTTTGVVTATTLSGDVTVNGAGVTAITPGVIVDNDIKSDAAIALSKLNTGDLPSGIKVLTANITDGTILSTDLNYSTAVASGGNREIFMVTSYNAGLGKIGDIQIVI
jgi:hypothetical protein